MTTEVAVEIWERVKAGQILPQSPAVTEALVRLADAYASIFRIEDLRVLRLHAAILSSLPFIESEAAQSKLRQAITDTSAVQTAHTTPTKT